MIDVCRHCAADIEQVAVGVWTCVAWGISTCELDGDDSGTAHAPIPSTSVEIEKWLAS